MTIYETIKRRLTRAHKQVDKWIGYANSGPACDGPALSVQMGSGWTVEIGFQDLAHLVRKADELANRPDWVNDRLQGWREFGAELPTTSPTIAQDASPGVATNMNTPEQLAICLTTLRRLVAAKAIYNRDDSAQHIVQDIEKLLFSN